MVQGSNIVLTVSAISEAKYAALEEELVHADDDALPLVLTADTLVACDSQIMGKPTSDEHLVEMLTMMSGRSLAIATAVCVGVPGAGRSTEVEVTTVQLHELTSEQIQAYLTTGAGNDKAGGLALQREAADFIAGVDGCWSNVLGLPLCSVVSLLGSAPTRRCSVELCGGPSR